MTAYANDSFFDLLSEFLSGRIVCRTVREIRSTPDYYQSQERQEERNRKYVHAHEKLSVDVGKLSPYIDITSRAGPVELRKTRFPFRLSGKMAHANPRVTIFRIKILRAAPGTLTPSFSIHYSGREKERLINTFEMPIRFNGIGFAKPAPGREDGAGPPVAPA